MQARIDEVNRLLREQITGIRVVRAFVREPHETERFATANDELTDVAMRAGRWLAAMFPAVMLVANVASRRRALVRRPPGRLRRHAGRRPDRVPRLPDADPDGGDDGHLHDDDGAARGGLRRPDHRGARHRDLGRRRRPTRCTEFPARGTLELDGVELTYPGADAPVLRDVTFRCRARPDGRRDRLHRRRQDARWSTWCRGCSTPPAASCGSTGSTYADLDPELLWSRDRAGAAAGVPVLRHRRSNLLHGKPDATDDELWSALEIAQAADFVREMPEGLDAPIAQGGTNVCGGQRQRLAIARAVVKRPEIYLFDDSFSALDLATDARLRAALRPVTRDATVLIVAQRVSTIRDADLILVLEDGVVVGRGTHEELLETSRPTRRSSRSQLSAEEAVA